MSKDIQAKTDVDLSKKIDDEAFGDAEKISNDITQALHRSKSFPKTIGVSLKDGEVKLTGAVPSSSDKVTAEETAKSEPGTSRVQNDINVP